MPRSVRIALVAGFVLGLLGLGQLAFWIADVAFHVPHQQIVTALHLPRSLDHLVTALWVAFPAIIVPGIVRRDDRSRVTVFSFALGMSILIGLMFVIVVAIGAVARGPIGIADVALSAFLIFVPYAALAWGLSRPSAKAWFKPTATS